MLLENVRPLMIVWLPVNASFGVDWDSNLLHIRDSFKDDTVDFILRRTSDQTTKVSEIPIPFYFYERLSDDKSNNDSMTGFLLDSCSENIDLVYPDTPTTQSDTTPSAIANVFKAQETFVVKNTIDVSFRVKLGSTPVSIFRALMKRVLTNPDITKNISFSWFWREYVLTSAKCIDYNEEPISGTDLVLIKIKFQHAQSKPWESTATNATEKQLPPDPSRYVAKP